MLLLNKQFPQPLKTAGQFVAVVLLVVLAVTLRLHSRTEPLHTDICVYSYIGQQMLAGEELYTDLIDNKPPGIYWMYALAHWLGGPGEGTIIWLGMCFTLLSGALIYLLLLRLSNSRIAFVGGLAWVLMSNSVHLHMSQPNTETFINAFLLAALLLFWQARQKGWKSIELSSLALGCASLFKTNVFFVFLVFGIYLAWSLFRNRALAPADKAGKMARYLWPAGALWAGVAWYFFYTQRFTSFYDVVFRALHMYAGNVFLNEIKFIVTPSLWLPVLKHELLLLCAVALVYAYVTIRHYRSDFAAILLCYLLGAVFMVGSLSNPYIQYYQVLVPPLVIVLALTIDGFRHIKAGTQLQKRLVAGLVLAICVGSLLIYNVQYLRLTPDQISIKKYGEGLVIEKRLAKFIRAVTGPEDKIYQWGNSGHFYLNSHRKAASGNVIHHLLFFSPPDVYERTKNKIFDAVMKNQPAFILFCDWIGKFENNMIFKAIQKQYSLFGVYDRILIYKRNDFKLRGNSRAALETITQAPTDSLKTATLTLKKQMNKEQLLALVNRPKDRRFATYPGNSRYAGLIREGNGAAKQGKWDRALELWKEAHDLHRWRPEATANIGLFHEQVGSLYLAMNHYGMAFHHLGAPWDRYYREVQKQLMLKALLAEKSVRPVQRYQRNLAYALPGTPYAKLLEAANARALKQQWQEAKKLWEEMLKKHPEAFQALGNLGIYFEINKDLRKALFYYQEAARHLGEPWQTYAHEVEQLLGQSNP